VDDHLTGGPHAGIEFEAAHTREQTALEREQAAREREALLLAVSL